MPKFAFSLIYAPIYAMTAPLFYIAAFTAFRTGDVAMAAVWVALGSVFLAQAWHDTGRRR